MSGNGSVPPDALAIYDQLRRHAQQLMGRERIGHTLSATALLHEAYLRLPDAAKLSRPQFYAAASLAMRRVLVDHARTRAAFKRGQGRNVQLDGIGDAMELATNDRNLEILILDEALSRLEAQDAAAAELVRLRFFAGLDIAQTADALGVSTATVKREWRYARATLYGLLRDDVSDAAG